MSELKIYYGYSPELLADAMAVRQQVFIDEQGVPPEREQDGLDISTTTQYVGYIANKPVSVARTRCDYPYSDDYDTHDVKIERVGVLRDHRGEGIGKELMRFIMSTIEVSTTVRNVVLESQVHAQDFYEELGFRTVGKVFQDAGIPHIKMIKTSP